MKKLLTLALCLLFAGPAFAATDGTIGATSTGTSTITLEIPKLILINGMQDLTFTGLTAEQISSTGTTQNTNICVSSNLDTGGTYSIVALGSGAGNAFTLNRTGATSETIAYTVKYNDQTGTSGSVNLTANSTLTGQTENWAGFDDTCATKNANYQVSFAAEGNLKTAHWGTYTGTLTLTVEPE